MHHVSLERDKLRTDLSRTLEENRKLVREGDEHVDLVTQMTEDKIKYVCLSITNTSAGNKLLPLAILAASEELSAMIQCTINC